MTKSSPRTIRVTPIYGWGWFEAGSSKSVEVPAPFVLPVKIEGRGPRFVAKGAVSEPGHLLDGLLVALSQRHTAWDGVCNLIASGPEGAARYDGYAQINVDDA